MIGSLKILHNVHHPYNGTQNIKIVDGNTLSISVVLENFDKGDFFPDPLKYGQLVGSLNYLTTTRPNISFAIHNKLVNSCTLLATFT